MFVCFPNEVNNILLTVKIMRRFDTGIELGELTQWQSARFACEMSWVRFPHSPLFVILFTADVGVSKLPEPILMSLQLKNPHRKNSPNVVCYEPKAPTSC